MSVKKRKGGKNRGQASGKREKKGGRQVGRT